MSNIVTLIKSINNSIENFNKNPNRDYTCTHLLNKSNELKEIKEQFSAAYYELLKKNGTLAIELKEKFEQSYNVLDKIIQRKIDKILKADLQTNNMASFDIQIALKVIPEFQGDTKDLNNFLNLVEFVHDDLKDATEKGKLIKFILRTRLSEKVKNKLSIVTPPTDFTSLRNVLQDIFRVNKTPLKIQSELAKLSQGNRTVKDFASHIEDLVSQLNSLQIAEQGETHREIIAKLNDQIGLNSFKSGLHENIKNIVFAASPKTLQEAVRTASEAEVVGTARVFNYNSRRFNNYSQNRNRYNNNFNNFRNRDNQSRQNNGNFQRNSHIRRTNSNNIGQNNNNYRRNYQGNNNRRGNTRVNVLQSGNEQIPEESGEN